MFSCNTTGEALNDARYAQLNAAVDRLAQLPNVSVYLDGTNSAWLGAGEAAHRLVKAGVARTHGFILNASNYQPTPQLAQYGKTTPFGLVVVPSSAGEVP